MATGKVGGLEERLRFLEGAAAGFKGAESQVGWFPDARYSDGTPVAMVANIQEFGAPAAGIPPRSFFRATASEKNAEWAASLRRGVTAATRGKIKPDQVLVQVGQKAAGDIRQTLAAGRFEKLSDTTLRLRKMVDEGLPRGAITAATVGQASREAKEGYPLSSRTQPLHDTGYMINTLTSHLVKEK